MAARVTGVIRVVSVADLPLNSPRGFRPAPGARFFANRRSPYLSARLSRVVSNSGDKGNVVFRHRTTSGTFRWAITSRNGRPRHSPYRRPGEDILDLGEMRLTRRRSAVISRQYRSGDSFGRRSLPSNEGLRKRARQPPRSALTRFLRSALTRFLTVDPGAGALRERRHERRQYRSCARRPETWGPNVAPPSSSTQPEARIRDQELPGLSKGA